MPEPLDIIGQEPDPLHALAYLSTPTVAFSDRDLSDLLLSARRWNARYGITGKLLALEDDEGRLVRFAQWIEGARTDLEACVGRIVADTRHAEFDVRHRGPIDGRRFPGWDMAIQTIGADAFDAQAALLADG